MAVQIPLGNVAAAADAVEFSSYAYVSGAVYWDFVGRDATGTKRSFHFIAYSGTPTSDASFNNAPLPSLFLDLTNYKIYIKTGTGATWTLVASNT